MLKSCKHPKSPPKHGQTRPNTHKHPQTRLEHWQTRANAPRQTRVKHRSNTGQTRTNTGKHFQTRSNTTKHWQTRVKHWQTPANTTKHVQTRQLTIGCVSCISTCDLLAKPCSGYCISYLSRYLVMEMCFCKSCKHGNLLHNQFAGLHFLAHLLTTCNG